MLQCCLKFKSWWPEKCPGRGDVTRAGVGRRDAPVGLPWGEGRLFIHQGSALSDLIAARYKQE